MNSPVLFDGSKSTAITSRFGKVTGHSYSFGSMSPAELREAGKSLGHKGTALNNYVGKALRNESAMRGAQMVASVSVLHGMGYVGGKIEVRNNTAVARWVKPAADKKSDADKLAKVSAVANAMVVKLRALGVSEAEIALLVK